MFNIQGLGFWVWGLGCRVQGSNRVPLPCWRIAWTGRGLRGPLPGRHPVVLQCLYVRIYIYIYIYILIYIYTYLFIFMYMCIYIYILLYIYHYICTSLYISLGPEEGCAVDCGPATLWCSGAGVYCTDGAIRVFTVMQRDECFTYRYMTVLYRNMSLLYPNMSSCGRLRGRHPVV